MIYFAPLETVVRLLKTKLPQVSGGEIPPSAEVGQPLLAKYRNIFKTQTAQGGHSLHGVYSTRALCLPVAGLCKSVWGVTGTPHFFVHGTSPTAAVEEERYDDEL